ncbi:hypothetical protein ZIOFF_003879 [Zingiber officinale]|uniref:EF-hand domain-containing protein n=1 Tax=Zingiber officinale TaxID=94328 RepID=A0A8J5HYB0_ZINOF|nr:hypothetical protein ZIOFF_003879 [Zingiber officinale]
MVVALYSLSMRSTGSPSSSKTPSSPASKMVPSFSLPQKLASSRALQFSGSRVLLHATCSRVCVAACRSQVLPPAARDGQISMAAFILSLGSMLNGVSIYLLYAKLSLWVIPEIHSGRYQSRGVGSVGDEGVGCDRWGKSGETKLEESVVIELESLVTELERYGGRDGEVWETELEIWETELERSGRLSRMSALTFNLDYPWLQNANKAPNVNLGETVRARLQQFSVMNKFKKKALRVIAEHLSVEEIADIKEMFENMNINKKGQINFDELKYGLRKLGHQVADSDVKALLEAVSYC